MRGFFMCNESEKLNEERSNQNESENENLEYKIEIEKSNIFCYMSSLDIFRYY